MNARKFSDAMSELDTKYIDEALNYKKKGNKIGGFNWKALAACFASQVNGTSITAGYFVTDPNSKGEQNAIYYAAFEIGTCKVYVENGGTKADSEATKNQLAEIIQKLTEIEDLDLLIKGLSISQ